MLDASALLALLQEEPGGESVKLGGSVINSVNFAEVVQKSLAKGKPVQRLLGELRLLGLEVAPFTPEEGVMAAELYNHTRAAGLSLGDRACLATARSRNGVAVTADRAWDSPDHGVAVRVIR